MTRTFDIVVVDDDPTTGDVICAILDDEGYRTRRFTEGGAALAAVRSNPPDLVVLDWLMRGAMQGEVLFSAIRQSPMAGDIPVLVCTAEVRILESHPWLRDVRTEVVTKPFDLDDLVDVVAQLIRPGQC